MFTMYSHSSPSLTPLSPSPPLPPPSSLPLSHFLCKHVSASERVCLREVSACLPSTRTHIVNVCSIHYLSLVALHSPLPSPKRRHRAPTVNSARINLQQLHTKRQEGSNHKAIELPQLWGLLCTQEAATVVNQSSQPPTQSFVGLEYAESWLDRLVISQSTWLHTIQSRNTHTLHFSFI